jgi:hypothetical protein
VQRRRVRRAVGPPAWTAGIPCWCLLGSEDKAIAPALQGFMAERANATIVEIPPQFKVISVTTACTNLSDQYT